jgi:hypothetical protein
MPLSSLLAMTSWLSLSLSLSLLLLPASHHLLESNLSSSHARQQNRTNVPPGQRSQQSFFISIIGLVHAVALVTVIVVVAGWGWCFTVRSTNRFATDR